MKTHLMNNQRYIVLAALFGSVILTGCSEVNRQIRAQYVVKPYTLTQGGAWQTAMQLESGKIVSILMVPGPDKHFKQYLNHSLDGGRSWQRVRQIEVDNPFSGNWGFTDLLKLSDGRWAAVASRAIPEQHNGALAMISISSDQGFTWSPVKLVGTADQEGVYYKMNDRTIQMRSGRLIVPNSHAVDPDAVEGATNEALVWISDDGGETWKKSIPCVVPDTRRGMQEACVVELDDGRLMILARTGSGCHYQSYSNDGGWTWSKSEPTSLIAGCSPLTVKKMPDGRLFVVYNHGSPKTLGDLFPRFPIHYAVSDDNGFTWSPPIIVDDVWNGESVVYQDKVNFEYGYPSICFLKNGILLTYGNDISRKCCVIEYPK